MAGNITLTMSADDAKVIASLTKQAAKMREVTQEAGRARRQKRGFNDEAERSGGLVGRLVAQYGGLAAIIGTATAALRQFNEEQKRGVEARQSQFDAIKGLSQIAGGDTERLRSLQRQAENISVAQGISFQEASRTVFAGASQGFAEDDISFLGSLANTAISGESAANTVGQLRSVYGNLGSVRNTTSQILQAAEFSPVGFNEFSHGVAPSAASAQAIGTTQSELLAIISVLAKAAGGASEAGTQVAALAAYIQENGPVGNGILGAMYAIEQRVSALPENQIQQHFGRKEAFRAFIGIRNNFQEIKAVEAQILTAGDRDLVGQNISAVNEVFAPEILQRRAEQLNAFVEGANARGRLISEANQTIGNAASKTRDPGLAGAGSRFFGDLITDTAQNLGVNSLKPGDQNTDRDGIIIYLMDQIRRNTGGLNLSGNE